MLGIFGFQTTHPDVSSAPQHPSNASWFANNNHSTTALSEPAANNPPNQRALLDFFIVFGVAFVITGIGMLICTCSNLARQQQVGNPPICGPQRIGMAMAPMPQAVDYPNRGRMDRLLPPYNAVARICPLSMPPSYSSLPAPQSEEPNEGAGRPPPYEAVAENGPPAEEASEEHANEGRPPSPPPPYPEPSPLSPRSNTNEQPRESVQSANLEESSSADNHEASGVTLNANESQSNQEQA